jgi:hypothetical protein
MDDKILDEKSLSKPQNLQHCKSTMSILVLQGMTNNVELTFSVGDTTPRFTISIEQDHQNW